MTAKASAIAKPASDRFRSFAAVAAAIFFLLAQAVFAAHASTPVEELLGHSAAECATCLAGNSADDPTTALPTLNAPFLLNEAVKTAIPAALLTDITVRAASPRAPPHN